MNIRYIPKASTKPIKTITVIPESAPPFLLPLYSNWRTRNLSCSEFVPGETMRSINPSLASYEKIAKVVVMKEVWSIDNGLLTPTMKIKRNHVEKIHMPMYKQWFGMEEDVIYEV